MSLLEVEDIWTAYGPIIVNRGVSIAVDEGEIVTIIGSNGAGKSTLLKTIAGLKRPKSGTIRFSDKDVTGTYEDGIARRDRQAVIAAIGRKRCCDEIDHLTEGERNHDEMNALGPQANHARAKCKEHGNGDGDRQ